MEELNREFELGRLYYDRAEFAQALGHLETAAAGFLSSKSYKEYLEAIVLVLRLYAEQERFEEIHAAKEKLQDLVLNQGFELNSRTYYVLGICAASKGQETVALDYFQKALALGLSTDNKPDICHAIYGLAKIYTSPSVNRFQDALKEIYNLEVFFQVYDIPDLRLSAMLLNADILNQMKKHDEAVQVLWRAYDILRETRNMTTGVYLLIQLADNYWELGEKEMARMYLSMAQRQVDPNNSVRLAKIVDIYLKKMGQETQSSYDLVFDETNHAVIEKKLGKIDFKNQFILLDLLRLFVQNQGTVYSKEYLVENVWKQPYDPAVHDNKIYVTIKRLRKMIEPDYDRPKYIFRAKNGYYMNKQARVHLEH